MTSAHRRFIVMMGCLFLCLGYSACKLSKYDVTVKPNFKDEVAQQQNLEFVFNKDLWPDSLLNRWESTEFFEITPKVGGIFKWSAKNTLTFSPNQNFEPGVKYSLQLNRAILDRVGGKLSFDSTPIQFHTPGLKVQSADVSWVRGNNMTDVLVQLDIRFNYSIESRNAIKKLKLKSGDKNIVIEESSNLWGPVLSVRFPSLNDKDEATPLLVTLEKGIKVSSGDCITEKDTTFKIDIPSRYTLAVTGISAQHTGTEGIVNVNTSQPVLDNNIKQAITIEPKVNFEVMLKENGFIIKSAEFNSKKDYQIKVSKELQSAFGGKLKNEYSERFSFGMLKPSITFVNSKGMYLSSAGAKNVALQLVNVSGMELYVIKVFENNFERFFDQSKDYDYHSDDEGGSSHYEFYRTADLGDTVFKKSFDANTLPKLGETRLLNLDIEDKLRGYDGIYIVCVRSKDQAWVQDSKIISLSDIGLTVKEEKDAYYVFANSIKNATPIPGAKISFISSTNQKMYTAVTDAEGVAVYKGVKASNPIFKVAMLTAKTDNDFNMLMLRRTAIGTSRYDVGGRYPLASGQIAMVYPERNLYRPGETMNIAAILRNESWLPIENAPLKFKLIGPEGKEFGLVRKTVNAQGTCDASFVLPPATGTGDYTVELYSGNDVLLTSMGISVEDFIPDRIKVTSRTEKKSYEPGEKVTVIAQADNLFGTPAGGRHYESELHLRKVPFQSEKYDDYHFDLNNEVIINPDLHQGKTQPDGSIKETFDLSANLATAGVLNGYVSTTVFDESERPVHRYATFKVFGQKVYIGINSPDYYVNSSAPAPIPMIALDNAGNPVTTEADVLLIHKVWHSTILEQSGEFRYSNAVEERIVSRKKVKISGTNYVYSFTPGESGEFEVRVFLNGANNYVSQTVYAYGWADTHYSSFQVDNEGNVAIKTDKKEYNLGENIKVLFTTPFEGRMIVTLERAGVLKYYQLNTHNKTAELVLKGEEAMIPNVYVSATLFRPMDGNDMPLTVAHGYQSVTVLNKRNDLKVAINAVEKSYSQLKQTIKLKTEPGADVTIAAVDEGILQIKNFKTPNPFDYFYQKIALSVNSYDIYPWLMPELKQRLSSTGGDGGGENRVNPLFVNRVKNVSFWSGVLKADAAGNVKYDIDIPQFSGDIRIMAVVNKGKGFGSAEKHMKVADPVVISTALPRFFSPGDEAIMPVMLTNTTEKAMTVTLGVKTTGPLDLKSQATQTVTIPANKEQRIVFNVAAQPVIGAAKVLVSVKNGTQTFTNETEISVRPSASLQKLTGSGQVADGKSVTIGLNNNFIPASVSGKLVVAKSPIVKLGKQMTELVQYPYGCVEQTTSAAFPQLYYADLVKGMDLAPTHILNPAYNVQQAILKLQAMQVGDGGLTYWPEGGEESWWGSTYACHFLLEAKKAGYDVNQSSLNRLIQYIKAKLYRKETTVFYYNHGKSREVVPEEVPYSLYVLALAAQPDQSTMNYYKAHTDILTLDGRYLLGAAYALTGQPTQAKQIIPSGFSGEIPDNSFSGSFYSAIRDEAMSLNVMIDIDPQNQQVGIMAKHLSEEVARARYLNTQENAFTLLALGKVARMANIASGTAEVTMNGKLVSTVIGSPEMIDLKGHSNENVAVKVKGGGPFYYFYSLNGVSSDGSYKQEDSYMKVRRTYFDRTGHEKTGNFVQNELIVVRVTVQGLNNRSIPNVAITDMLPAGFEIENPRLQAAPGMEWIKDAESPDYMDIRDDRLNMFTTVYQKPRVFYYMVRVVSAGTFKLGPVQADAMYSGEYHSYNGGRVIKVLEK